MNENSDIEKMMTAYPGRDYPVDAWQCDFCEYVYRFEEDEAPPCPSCGREQS